MTLLEVEKQAYTLKLKLKLKTKKMKKLKGDLTLENIKVDCKGLTQGQIKEMASIVLRNGLRIWDDPVALKADRSNYYFFKNNNNDYLIGAPDFSSKTEITYDVFMDLFGKKELPGHTESENGTIVPEEFNPQPHYDNNGGSLFLKCEELGLNSYEMDIFRRICRARKKGQFLSDMQKIKDTVDLYVKEKGNEYSR